MRRYVYCKTMASAIEALGDLQATVLRLKLVIQKEKTVSLQAVQYLTS